FYTDFSKRLEIPEKEMKEIEIKDEPAGIDCEKCGHEMVYKMGRYGKFMACSNFPNCRNTKPILKKIGVTCSQCKKGDDVERSYNKRRELYGSDSYPDCDYVSWDQPIERRCPKSEATLVEKKLKKGNQNLCTKCDYKEGVQT